MTTNFGSPNVEQQTIPSGEVEVVSVLKWTPIEQSDVQFDISKNDDKNFYDKPRVSTYTGLSRPVYGKDFTYKELVRGNGFTQFRDTNMYENSYTRDYFVQLLTKAIEADNIDYVTVLIQEHDVKFDHSCFPDLYKEAFKCKINEHDCRHLYAVLKKDKSHEGLFEKDQKSNEGGIEKSESQCIKVGRELCRQFLNYRKGKKIKETKSGERVVTENAKSENTDDNRYYQDLLIWSLFAHRPRLALLFWKWSEDKLVTALLAAALLKRMALKAIKVADKSVYEELMDHSRLFEQRSLKILETLYKKYPSEATNLMTSVFTVWDIDISPLRCAYESEFYDFVAHACSQRCLDKIWYNTQDASAGASQEASQPLMDTGETKKKTGSEWKFRVLRAPRTKFILHYIIFLAAVVTYSAFLLTNLKTTDHFGVYEICVYIWLFSDMIEEYLIPIFQRLKNPLRTAGHKYSLRRYMSDFWNVLDTVSYITTFVAIALRFSDTTLPWARRVYSFSLFFMYMRFLHVILIFKKIGVYVILIKEMMKDLGRFLVILIVFMMAVGVMFHVNMYPNHEDMFSNKVQYWRIWKIISFPYWQIYGEIFLDDIMGIDNSSCSYNQSDVERCVEYDWINIVIVAFYMLLSNLLLVNLVIALFSARFEKVRSNSKKIWSYIRYSYVMEYSVRVPAVVNLIVRPIMVICGCVCCRKCKTQQVSDSSKQKEDQQKLQEEMRKQLQYIRTLQSICSVRCT
ncbi:unnamed protein product [Mytilus edulis]|uniref:Ion transport domain-containing protein n=1 Tax=Mytilus edulis TaxID=6550 RepID=A0A8S3V9W9_MYTED|nr:unnamed protein product [Mytilus edulis]